MNSEKPWNLLIVDDEPSVLATISDLIKDLVVFDRRLTISTATDSISAKKILSEKEIHLAIIDISLEQSDSGLALVRFLRNNLNNHQTRILIITGNLSNFSPSYITKEFDIDGFIIKPHLIKDILTTNIITAFRSLIKEDYLAKVVKAKDNNIIRLNLLSEQIIRSKTVLHTVINKATKVPIVVISDELIVTHYNVAAKNFFGISEKDVLGMNLNDVHNIIGVPRKRLHEVLQQVEQNIDFNMQITREVFGNDLTCNISIFTVRIEETKSYVLSGDKIIPSSQSLDDSKEHIDFPANEYVTDVAIPEIICKDRKMLEICKVIRNISHTNASVCIGGESGTGKEIVAKAVHDYSSRSGERYLAINCAALPSELLEGELFGYKKGAFTGADTDKKGLFEFCDGGTLFLDEIGEASLAVQSKLLRVLQDGSFLRIGSGETIKVDVRIICATNKHLPDEIIKKTFREDLYYRLCVIPINIPPIRNRRIDIPLLIRYFLQRYDAGSKNFNEDSKRFLGEYMWPGNVREIQNVAQYISALCKGNIIEKRHFPESIQKLFHQTQPATISEPEPKPASKLELDRPTIEKVLQECNGNRSKAAKMLKVHRSTLYRKMEELEMG